MSITLTAEQESIVADLIATGSFQTADEVLQAALTLLETDRESYQAWLRKTRELAKEGIDSLDRGEGKVYTDETLHELIDEIKTQGRINLGLQT
jgi:antitoxin ParD1/3/4